MYKSTILRKVPKGTISTRNSSRDRRSWRPTPSLPTTRNQVAWLVFWSGIIFESGIWGVFQKFSNVFEGGREPESLCLLPGLDAGQRGRTVPRAVWRARGADRERWTRLRWALCIWYFGCSIGYFGFCSTRKIQWAQGVEVWMRLTERNQIWKVFVEKISLKNRFALESNEDILSEMLN